jgi:hypothetical protein
MYTRADARLRGDARGRDGRVRENLAKGMILDLVLQKCHSSRISEIASRDTQILARAAPQPGLFRRSDSNPRNRCIKPMAAYAMVVPGRFCSTMPRQ